MRRVALAGLLASNRRPHPRRTWRDSTWPQRELLISCSTNAVVLGYPFLSFPMTSSMDALCDIHRHCMKRCS